MEREILELDNIIPYGELRTLVLDAIVNKELLLSSDNVKKGILRLKEPILFLSVVSLRGSVESYEKGTITIKNGKIGYLTPGFCIGIDNSVSSSMYECVNFARKEKDYALEIERHSKKKGIILKPMGPGLDGDKITSKALSWEHTVYVGGNYGENYLLCIGLNSLKEVLKFYCDNEVGELFLEEHQSALEQALIEVDSPQKELLLSYLDSKPQPIL